MNKETTFSNVLQLRSAALIFAFLGFADEAESMARILSKQTYAYFLDNRRYIEPYLS